MGYKHLMYVIERQFTPDSWVFVTSKLTFHSAETELKRCRELFPNEVFRLVHIHKEVLET